MAVPTSQVAPAGPSAAVRARGARRFLVGISAIAALGGALFGYDTGVISGALPFMEDHFGLTSLGEGVITSALLIGAAFGSLIGGRMSDALGRRNSLLWAGAVFLGGALAVALSPSVAAMTVARFVLGLAVGSASVITPLYLSEIAPPHIRGRLVSFNSLMIVSGQLLAYLLNAVLAHWAAWRWMLGLAALPAVALSVGLLFLPDTPRWYISKGRRDEAARVLGRTLPAEDVPAELARIDHARALEDDARRGAWQQLRTPWVRRLLLVGIGLAAVQQITGVNAVVYFAPKILASTGLGTGASITATIAVGVISVVATAVGMSLIDRVGRRPMLLTGLAGMTVSLALLGASFHLPHSPAVSALVLGLMVLYMAFMQATLNTGVWLLLAEMFPLQVRGLAMGAAVFVMWLVNFGVAMAFPLLLDAVGAGTTFWFFGAMCVLSWVFCQRYAPETKGLALEDLERELRKAAAVQGN
ncbi:major inositol transporter-like SP family MFS transporter [Streptomyces sp. 2333.5]|uniref:sugar porter family MFS transporter n=1 Tax=unclassified Streptomyces TaxID=2593676 RepID=UPI00089D6B66|nr:MULTISPECIES: sugar porter family MFS transporter [unclassified Streptomyces]PJJ02072.1 major inositol transporter-like SP family MFS transporter [Streptomyces sp. 2333.5]SEC94251.1 MFS transporter, SP family, major inositol transporter [Streptomyces sp. 2314.4]SED80028.1 MFS transporter, SP family, major inositol transporter [Streptomyces sp. 2112.2]